MWWDGARGGPHEIATRESRRTSSAMDAARPTPAARTLHQALTRSRGVAAAHIPLGESPTLPRLPGFGLATWQAGGGRRAACQSPPSLLHVLSMRFSLFDNLTMRLSLGLQTQRACEPDTMSYKNHSTPNEISTEHLRSLRVRP